MEYEGCVPPTQPDRSIDREGWGMVLEYGGFGWESLGQGPLPGEQVWVPKRRFCAHNLPQILLPSLELEGQDHVPQRPALHSLAPLAVRSRAVLSVSGLALCAWGPGCSDRILFLLGAHWDLVWTHLPWDRWGARVDLASLGL